MTGRATAPPATPWYAAGLRFTCRGCGTCCTGAPGYVWVTDAELDTIARHLGMETMDLRAQCVKTVRAGQSLRERGNGDCVFFRRGEGCTIYAVRPTQCRTFPFWPEILESPEAWASVARECPGMNDGATHKRADIESALHEETGGESC